jgi:hypothetical protein
MHGQTNKQAEGNEDISHYKNISQPTLADIIKHPDKYYNQGCQYNNFHKI